MEREPLSDPTTYFPCDHCKQLPHYSNNTRPCVVERYYNTFILKRTAACRDRSQRGNERDSGGNFARVYPSITSIVPGGGTSETMFDHLTGTVRHIEGDKVLQRYKGTETEFILKIQVPWTLFGPCMNENLMAYNESRDFRVTIKNTDRDCRKIRDKILSDGFMCVNPGMKLYFRAKLYEDFTLDVYLDHTSFQNW